MEVNQVYQGDSAELMKKLPDNFIDLTVTSPPYDNLRDYNGYSFDFETIAKELFRITKEGGVVVWIVGDATINGSETGTSFKQALYFKEMGFNLHDTMIWNKNQFSAVGSLVNRYAPVFEYMFILSKNYPKTFNPIKDKFNKSVGRNLKGGTVRLKNGKTKSCSNPNHIVPKYSQRNNIWDISPEMRRNIGLNHPAMFPEQIAKDHIISWSNKGDLVFDPFAGSGTTLKMAMLNDRNYLGFEISAEYCDLINKRIGSNLSGFIRTKSLRDFPNGEHNIS